MFILEGHFELGIINRELYKIINNEWAVTAKGTCLSRISLLNFKRDSAIEFDREIQELLFGDLEELIVFMGKKSKRLNLVNWTKIEDGEFEKYRISPMSIFGGNIFVRLEGEVKPGLRTRGLYNVYEKRILWKSEAINNPVIMNGLIFSNSINKVERFDLETGEMLWSQSVLKLGSYYVDKLEFNRKVHEGEVDCLLGIYKKVLWILLNNGMLLGLDIETGDIVDKVGAPKQYPAELFMMEETRESNFYYNHQSIFDSKQGKIIRLWHAGNSDANYAWYFEVDLNSTMPELAISKVDNITNRPFTIDGNPCPLWPFDDDYMYVCNYRDYKLALFNRKTKKIDWIHQMEADSVKKSFIIKMEVRENYWYVLDNSKTLYVYKRKV